RRWPWQARKPPYGRPWLRRRGSRAYGGEQCIVSSSSVGFYRPGRKFLKSFRRGFHSGIRACPGSDITYVKTFHMAWLRNRGISMSVETAPTKPVVVFVHGFASDRSCWAPLLKL